MESSPDKPAITVYAYDPSDTVAAFAPVGGHGTHTLSRLLLMHAQQSAAVASTLSGGTQYLNATERTRLSLAANHMANNDRHRQSRYLLSRIMSMAATLTEIYTTKANPDSDFIEEMEDALKDIDVVRGLMETIVDQEEMASEHYYMAKASIHASRTDAALREGWTNMHKHHEHLGRLRAEMQEQHDLFEERVGDAIEAMQDAGEAYPSRVMGDDAEGFVRAKATYRSWLYSAALVESTSHATKQKLRELFPFREARKDKEGAMNAWKRDADTLRTLTAANGLADVPAFPQAAITTLTAVAPHSFTDSDMVVILRQPTATSRASRRWRGVSSVGKRATKTNL
jgi:hypothetical protein